MSKIYFISGLGADSVAFKNIGELGYEKVMVEWIINEDNESYTDYCLRLIKKYNIDSDAILVGLSFGGMTAQKIADILGIQKVILVSSFRTMEDFKPMVKNVFKTNAHKLIPEFQIPLVDGIVMNFLNSTSPLINQVLTDMIARTDRRLMTWSLKVISEQTEEINPSTKKINIIGTSDRILNTWENDATYKVKGGSHFMVYTKGKEVTNILNEILKKEF